MLKNAVFETKAGEYFGEKLKNTKNVYLVDKCIKMPTYPQSYPQLSTSCEQLTQKTPINSVFF